MRDSSLNAGATTQSTATMINLLTQSLGNIIKKNVTDTDVRYARIDENAPPSATINLFLYDVRGDAALQSNAPVVAKNNGGYTIAPAPLRVACTYLVTAWCGPKEEDVLQEQSLLDQALMAFSKYPTIPPELLIGELSAQDPPVPLVTSIIDGIKNPVEFWTVVGYKLRPAITVTATISMQPADQVPAERVTSVLIEIKQQTGE